MTAVTFQGARRCVLWPKDALRIGLGIIWLIDAVLKWLPGFRDGYMDTIMGIRDGQPSGLRWTTPTRPASVPTTTWRRRSPGGGGSPRCATRMPPPR